MRGKDIRVWVTVGLWLLSGGIQAQNLSTIESLRKGMNHAKGRDLYEILCALGFEYRYSFPDSTIYYCTRAYELGQSLKLTKNLSRPVSFIGLAYNNRGDYKKSLEFHERAIQIASDQKDSVQLGHSYNNLGRLFFDGGDLVRALDNFFRSREIFESIKDSSGLAYVYRSLANLYKLQGDFKQAVEMSDKAYHIRASLNDKRGMVSSLIEFGLLYESMNYFSSALVKFKQAEQLVDAVNDPVTKAELAIAMAEIQIKEKQFEQAHESARYVLNTVSATTNQKLFIRASLVRGIYLFEKRNYPEALNVLVMVLQEARNSGNLIYELEALKMIAAVYEKLGRSDRAEHYRNDYELQSEKLKNTDLLREIDRLQFQLSIEKYEAENKNLRALQLSQQTLIANQRFQNIILLVIGVSFLAMSLILYRYNRKRKKVNEKLTQQYDQIRNQQNVISQTNEELVKQNYKLNELNYEKDSLMSIVAHDLKSPLNRISGLVRLIELEGNLNSTQKNYIQLIHNATKSGTNLITDLLDVNYLNNHSQGIAYDEIELEKWLTGRAEAYQVSARMKEIKIETHYTTDGGATFRSVPDYCTRIVDNLLSNAIKFSPPKSCIWISASRENNYLAISIRDSGPGFSEEDRKFLFQKFKKLSARPTAGESSNGLGLAIVKTLVDRLQGTITLKSDPGEGAHFVVTIPAA
jgi:signal transduction histidine kinase